MSTPIQDTIIRGFIVTDGKAIHQRLFDERPTPRELRRLAFLWKAVGDTKAYYFQARVELSEQVKVRR